MKLNFLGVQFPEINISVVCYISVTLYDYMNCRGWNPSTGRRPSEM